MVYVALLRGINVGGNNKVDMKQLTALFEKLGMESVKTYINSGNIIFSNDMVKPEKLIEMLEKAIELHFGFYIKVLIKTIVEFKKIVEALSDSLKNDLEMKCDVMFLWSDADSKNILSQLSIKPEIDNVKYVSGAVLWSVSRKDVTKSGLLKIIGTPLYKQMTIRNCNTTRKLYEIMKLQS